MSDLWLHQGDATEWLRTLPDASVDLIDTDPAYASLEKHRKVGTTTRLKVSDGSSNAWFDVVQNSYFPGFLRECYRVLKKDRHLYFFCDEETADVVKPLGRAAGFTFWKSLVWVKVGSKNRCKLDPGLGYHWRSSREFILFFEKGKRKLNSLSICDVLPVPKVRGRYPTEKPVELNRILIEQSTQPGEIVIDPFMGSASAGEAALKAGRSFWGNDLSLKSLELAHARLSGYPGVQCLTALSNVAPPPQTRLAL
jgi:site-specific DNA-methyltransferase (adenine-specific)